MMRLMGLMHVTRSIVLLALVLPTSTLASDVGCGRDTDGNGTTDALCDEADHDRDGYPEALDCDDTDASIFPSSSHVENVTTKGCVDGWRVCQSDGTYTPCTQNVVQPYCPSQCLQCYYFDKINGNDSNPGTYASPWRTYDKFNTYWDAPPAGLHAPVAGDCFLGMTGTYTETHVYAGQTNGLLLRQVNGDPTHHVQLLAYPGQSPVITMGTRAVPERPLHIHQSSYIDVDGIGITQSVCDSNNVTPNAACLEVDESSNVRIQRMRIWDNDGIRDDNTGGIVVGTSSLVTVESVWVVDNFDSTIDGINNAGITFFRGSGNSVINSTIGYTDPGHGDCLKVKHHDNSGAYDRRFVFTNNFTFNCLDHLNSAAAVVATRNYFHGPGGINFADIGGSANFRQDTVFELNTIDGGDGIRLAPSKEYDDAGNACVSCGTIGTFTFRKNIFTNPTSAFGLDSGEYAVCHYGSEAYYADLVTSGKISFQDNCIGTPNATFAATIFGSGAAGNECPPGSSGAAPSGTRYTSSTDWETSGLSSGEFFEDPLLNPSRQATSEHCRDWGWSRAGLCGAAPAGGCRTPTVPEKALLQLRRLPNANRLTWQWIKGAVTPLADYGDPVTTDDYELCLYEGSQLRARMRAPFGGTCAGKPCWQAKTTSFRYQDKDLTPDGIHKITLGEGIVPGKAKIIVRGRGVNLPLPQISAGLSSALTVQLVKAGGICWEAVYSPPFLRNDGVTFKDRAD